MTILVCNTYICYKQSIIELIKNIKNNNHENNKTIRGK